MTASWRKSRMSATKPQPHGKKVAGKIYVHRSLEHLVVPPDLLASAKSAIEPFDYTIVKYDAPKSTVTFIHSPNFDTSFNPTVGESRSFSYDKGVTITPQSEDPLIYHGRYLMVAPEYTGFDQASDRTWYELTTSRLTDKDRPRIGRQSYWLSFLARENLSPPSSN